MDYEEFPSFETFQRDRENIPRDELIRDSYDLAVIRWKYDNIFKTDISNQKEANNDARGKYNGLFECKATRNAIERIRKRIEFIDSIRLRYHSSIEGIAKWLKNMYTRIVS